MNDILIIDDNKINIELICQFLKSDFPDYRLRSSLSGEEGLAMARKEKPDLLLLDIIMPGIDGFQLCRIFKNDPAISCPILLISALTDTESRVKGLNFGADAFLSKPVKREELKAQVNVMLRIKNAEEELRKKNDELQELMASQEKKIANILKRQQKITSYSLEFFWETDANGYLTYASSAIKSIFGYTENQLLHKKTLIELLARKCPHKEEEIKAYFLQQKPIEDFEIKVFNKDGQSFWISVFGIPFYQNDTDFQGHMGVCRDITNRKLSEFANKRQQKEIQKYQIILKKLNTRLAQTEEQERKKIAEYLHDSLGQTISIASMKLSALTIKPISLQLKQQIEEISQLLQCAIEESKSIVYQLSPPILYELGIEEAIKWRVEQVKQNFDIDCLLTCHKLGKINNELSIFIYRSTCEFINNVLKHSQSKRLNISLQSEEKGISLQVEDFGQGFLPATNPLQYYQQGWGLFSISERLEELNGKLQIDSAPGKGTKVTLFIPRNN